MSLAEAIPQVDTPPQQAGSDYGIVFGRYMRPDQQEYACQLTAIDTTQVTVITRGEADFGENLVLYLDDIGRLQGQVAHRSSSGFTLALSLSPAQTERLEQRLEWVKNKDQGESTEMRRHARYQPSDAASHLNLPDGRSYACEIIDISVSGAAVRVDVIPAIGTVIMLGKMRGRVTRIHAEGIGIEFVKMLDTAGLKSSFSF